MFEPDFVKVYRARMKYEPKAKFSTWLYRIAVNNCLNEIRARKSQPSLAAPINDMLEEPEGENPDARLSRAELVRRDGASRRGTSPGPEPPKAGSATRRPAGV